MEFLRRGWEKIKSYVHIASYEGIGIIPDFVFMQNLPPEAWERTFLSMETTPLGIKVAKRIVDTAQKRTEKERQALTQKMMSRKTSFKVGRNAKGRTESEMLLFQFIATINSMSQENLNTAQEALGRLILQSET